MDIRSDGTEGSETAKKSDLRILVDDVRHAWRMLWRNRIDDKVRAEGIANLDYSLLYVDRGTVITATRDFKPLDFREILRLHEIKNVERFIPPPPSVGGYHRFARTVLNRQRRIRRWTESSPMHRRRRKRKKLQVSKGGRGWLHFRMEK